MRIAGLIVLITTLMVGIGSNLTAMLDRSSGILVVGMTLGMILLGRHDLGAMFGGIFVGGSEEQSRAAVSGWRATRFYALATGATGAITGLVLMLKDMGDPSSIGPAMALCLLSATYATALAFFVCLPFQAVAGRRVGAGPDRSVTTSATLTLIFNTVLALLSFGVLLSAIEGAA